MAGQRRAASRGAAPGRPLQPEHDGAIHRAKAQRGELEEPDRKEEDVSILSHIKRFCCWIGWHSQPTGFEIIGFDGASLHARCLWCGYAGMLDSSGALF